MNRCENRRIREIRENSFCHENDFSRLVIILEKKNLFTVEGKKRKRRKGFINKKTSKMIMILDQTKI